MKKKTPTLQANVRTPRPIKALVVVDWQENEEIMRAFNELVGNVSGPAFEHLDESKKKAAQKRLPAGLENPLRNLDAIVLKLCDKKFPPSLLEELTKHIPYKKSMLRKQIKRLRLRKYTEDSRQTALAKFEILEKEIARLLLSENREKHIGTIWHVKQNMESNGKAEVSWEAHFEAIL